MKQEIISLKKQTKTIWWVRSIKKVCAALNYNEPSIILDSAITGCVLMCAFAPLVDIPVGIASSPVGLKICVIAAGMK